METEIFTNAHFIKLGKEGKWAEECLSNGIIRVGWDNVNVEEIRNEKWEDIKRTIEADYRKNGKRNGATQDYNALKKFCEANSADIFITFHNGQMYWCRLDSTPVVKDAISKFRKSQSGWSCNPINNKDKTFYTIEISGEISKTQAFQGTLCSYNNREIGIINRMLNGLLHENVEKIESYKKKICELTTEILKDFHPKDCEILTDLIFVQSGWRRVSMKGGNMEYTDMEYYDPVNNEKYAVQVKSGAKKEDFEKYKKKLPGRKFRKLFFVVFNPDNSILEIKDESADIELLCGNKLSTLIFDLGLLEWVLKKSK